MRPQARGRANPTYLSLEAFITCIRENKKPEVDVEVGRNAAISVLMANQAMEQARVVKFAEVAAPAKVRPAARKI